MREGSLRSSPSGSLTGSGALAGSWQRNQPVVTCSTHRSKNISKPNKITAPINFIWEIQMANVTGMCSKISSPNDYTLEVISLNAISLLNGCLRWSKMTRLRMLWLFYILEWMRLTAILHQVCSVSFTAFTNVCLHFCHRCSGMWNWNGVWIPKKFSIWNETERDILALWQKAKPFCHIWSPTSLRKS